MKRIFTILRALALVMVGSTTVLAAEAASESSYTGTSVSRYVTGYTISANYTGEVSKAGCNVVTYTAIFGSEDGAPIDHQDTPDAPDTTKWPVNLSGIKHPVLIGVVVLGLGAGGWFAFKKFIERR